MRLYSPTSGRDLVPHGPHALTDGAGERWPVVDGIPFLRAGRETLAQAALARLDGGDRVGALALLLADADPWWDEPPPPEADLRRVVEEAGAISLREAMARLGWGRVGDYFAHRWTDPTYLAGLALVEAHMGGAASAFELAGGIGHYAAAMAHAGLRVAMCDIVFGKLWVARHWVVPADVELVCFDAARPWPVRDRFDLVLCQDAFYFLEPKAEIAARLRDLAAGPLLVGHVHNRHWPNYSAGAAVGADELDALFPGARWYDDVELTLAAVEARAPAAGTPTELAGAEAFALAVGAGEAKVIRGRLGAQEGAPLRRNPLYGDDSRRRWPSPRYAAEYGPRATYPATTDAPERAALDAATLPALRRRELVQLPERW